jgi:Pyridoxamine 5'-phosphate oxidase
MRHEDVMEVLNDPLAQELMHSPLLARMAYNGMDGTPRAIPIGYLWNGAGFVMCTASIAPKVRALQANPKAALTIDTETEPPHVLPPPDRGPAPRQRPAIAIRRQSDRMPLL